MLIITESEGLTSSLNLRLILKSIETIVSFVTKRYVTQLQRITFKFCKTSVDSRGVRQFIETDLIDWSRKNPGVVVYLKPRRHRSPAFVTEYLNGMSHWMSAKNFGSVEIMWWLDFLRTRSGYELSQLLSPNNVSLPSIQGPWNPFLNRPTILNISKFPNPERGEHIYDQPSATQQLIEIAKSMNTTNNKDIN
jgi:large subunit ribosomal protein L43